MIQQKQPDFKTSRSQCHSVDDFVAVMPTGKFIFLPTGDDWPARSVDACVDPVPVDPENPDRLRIVASEWLRRHRPVDQVVWATDAPAGLLTDTLFRIVPSHPLDGVTRLHAPGRTAFNRWRYPPDDRPDHLRPVDLTKRFVDPGIDMPGKRR